MDDMKKCLEQSVCRRLKLLEYFGEKNNNTISNTLDCCDICRRTILIDHLPKYDLTNDTQMVFDSITALRGKTKNLLIKFIKGSNSHKLRDLSHNPLFAAGKKKDTSHWEDLIRVRDPIKKSQN